MVTVEHGLVQSALWLVLVLAGAMSCWLLFGHRNRWVRFVGGMGFAACLLASLVCGLGVLGYFGKDTLAKVRSPDGKQAAVLRHWGSKGKRQGTYVLLYSNHGLREQEIARGDFLAFQPAGIRWVSDAQIELVYDPRADGKPRCDNTPLVAVQCVPMR